MAVRLPFGRVPDMTEISVTPRGGDAYDVTVSDSDGSTTTHTVIAGAADVDRFGAGSDASSLIGASFRFLLDREEIGATRRPSAFAGKKTRLGSANRPARFGL